MRRSQEECRQDTGTGMHTAKTRHQKRHAETGGWNGASIAKFRTHGDQLISAKPRSTARFESKRAQPLQGTFRCVSGSRIGSRMPESASYCVLATAESDPADWIVTCWLRASCQRPSRSTQTRMLL